MDAIRSDLVRDISGTLHWDIDRNVRYFSGRFLSRNFDGFVGSSNSLIYNRHAVCHENKRGPLSFTGNFGKHDFYGILFSYHRLG